MLNKIKQLRINIALEIGRPSPYLMRWIPN